MENLPIGVSGPIFQWVDLDSDGLPGVLSDQGGVWYYKRSTSANNTVPAVAGQPDEGTTLARLEAMQLLATRPSSSIAHSQWRFNDVNGNGLLDLVIWEPESWGFFERTTEDDWTELHTFPSFPGV